MSGRVIRLRPACRSCGDRVGRGVDLCHGCVEHLPVERRWKYRDSYDDRRRDRDGYRIELTRAIAWLAATAVGRHRSNTQTAAEEAS